MNFKVGDTVWWISQASGYTKLKTGIIVAVVGKDCDPMTRIPKGYKFAYYPTGYGPRKNKSYLVSVPEKGVYWPLVSNLRKA